MRGKGTKLGEHCPKVMLSQDRMPIEPFGITGFLFVFGIFTSFGIVSFGIVSFGIVSFGIVSFGIVSFGIVSFGIASFGIFTSFVIVSFGVVTYRTITWCLRAAVKCYGSE